MRNEDLLAAEESFLGMNVGHAVANPDFWDPQQCLPYNATGLDSPSISMSKDILTNARRRSTARRREGEEEETVGLVRNTRSMCHRMTPEEFKYSPKDNLRPRKSKTEETKKSEKKETKKKSEKKETKNSENEKARKMKLADEIHDSQRKEQQNASRRKKQESTEFREKEQQQNAKQQSEKRKDPLVLIRDRANARASVYPCTLVILMKKHIFF